MELILIRERGLATSQSRTNIITFGEGEKFRIALKSSSEFNVGHGLSPGHILHPFLLALHTNLAADVAKLGVARARGGEHRSWYKLYFRVHSHDLVLIKDSILLRIHKQA